MPRKATNLAFVVYAAARLVIVCQIRPRRATRASACPPKRGLVVAVLLVPRLVGILSALLQQRRCDVVVDVLLEHVLVLHPGRLAP